MIPLAKNAFFIIRITIGGLFLTYLMTGVKPGSQIILGCLLVPLVILMVRGWLRKGTSA